jgi:hypothetical protein
VTVSTTRAIFAVTSTLRQVLLDGIRVDDALGEIDVTLLPLDKARDDAGGANRLNLFLYQTLPNAAWRNRDPQPQARPGESGLPALPLNLHYLLTAFADDSTASGAVSHRILGAAMLALHDHPLLDPAQVSAAFADDGVQPQAERIRITLQPLPVEDIFRLWSGFQTQYRLSVAYEVSVVLLESLRGVRAPLPVLARGRQDTGVSAVSDLVPPYPAIEAVTLPGGQPAFELGDTIVFAGHHLAGAPLVAVFRHALLPAPVELAAEKSSTDSRVTVQTKAGEKLKWLPGAYTVSLRVGTGDMARTTNEVGVLLALKIVGKLPVVAVKNGPNWTISFANCSPPVDPRQRVSLLLGDREIPAQPRTKLGGSLAFVATDLVPGTSPRFRIRVDGVDTNVIDRSATPPKFIANMTVKVPTP